MSPDYERIGMCDADFGETGMTHADYPHFPGALYDCPACESVCHCDPDDIVTLGDDRDMCVHCEIESEDKGFD